MKISVPHLLTFNGGYTDTAGFLALQGLFTAHVTGNFVTLAASQTAGGSGAWVKLLALPVFCLVVGLARFYSSTSKHDDASIFNTLVIVKIGLFVVAATVAITFGPFNSADDAAALVTGMALVAGMAIQNSVHRIFFSKAPPTTLMTGSTTQIMMDVADLMQADLSLEVRLATRVRVVTLLKSVGCFAFGCAAAAFLYMAADRMVLLVPPLISAVAFIPRRHAVGIPARR